MLPLQKRRRRTTHSDHTILRRPKGRWLARNCQAHRHGLLWRIIVEESKKHQERTLFFRGQSHRYEATAEGVRILTTLWALRDGVIKPLPAAACQLKSGRPPQSSTRLDQHYHTLQHDMGNLFKEFGIAP